EVHAAIKHGVEEAAEAYGVSVRASGGIIVDWLGGKEEAPHAAGRASLERNVGPLGPPREAVAQRSCNLTQPLKHTRRADRPQRCDASHHRQRVARECSG